MKRLLSLLIVAFVLFHGGMTFGQMSSLNVSGFKRLFTSFRLVRNGMIKKDVESVLNKKIIVGYEMSEAIEGQFKPITIENPYRTEELQKGKNTYQIIYYRIKIKRADDQITDDELLPLVFQNKTLIGMS